MPNSTPPRKSNPNKAVTLTDVAAHVGVSAVAVSVVLNNSQSKVRVSAATRERILQAAEELQYQPNSLARSLRLQRTNVIGFYGAHGRSLDPRFPFYGALSAGLQMGCRQHDKDLLLQSRLGSNSDTDIYMSLLSGQIDGLVLYAHHVTPLIERLIESRLPIVTVVHRLPGVPCVGIANEQSGRLLAQHLLQRGYKKALSRNSSPDLPLTVANRMRGFTEEATVGGMEVSHTYCDEQWPSKEEQELLTGSNRPDVVVSYSDHSADGIIAFCRENGLSVPTDLGIAGFDNLPSYLRPSMRLTTVNCPWTEVAQRAVGLLVDLHEGKEVPEYVELPVEIVEGETTRPLQ
ncbi:LacI family transcriptional regulator [bacterium]|nr:MAG: LacI family transcriptional regulator [bacterium]